MFSVFLLFSVASFLSLVLAQTGSDNSTYYGATDIASDPQNQPWNFDLASRCRLFSHRVMILKNDKHHLLVLDGGIAKFHTQYQGRTVEVLDLNSWTAMVDLSKPFNTNSFAIKAQIQKGLDVPVAIRYSLWADSNQDSVIMQGGEFYGTDLWNRSSYFVTKPNIPAYSVWKFGLGDKKWNNVTSAITMKGDFIRAVGGAGVSAPRLNMSFYIGGIQSPRCASTAPDLQMTPQGGMLVFDHSANTMTNESFGEPGSGMAYWDGSVDYLSIGEGKGFLISLMGGMGLAGVPHEDLPYRNDEHGDPVSFESVMFYNIDTKKWINQKTKAWQGNYPVPRSRFCGKTVFSQKTRTWEYDQCANLHQPESNILTLLPISRLWLYGGMLRDPPGDPIQDVFVLTMPSFVWVKIQIPGNDNSRSHRCEAIGSQLLVIGGYPPGVLEEKDAPCSKELIRIFDMNSISWTSEYRLDTEYITPDSIQVEAEFNLSRTSPASGGWADEALGAAFSFGPNPPIVTGVSSSPSPSTGGPTGVTSSPTLPQKPGSKDPLRFLAILVLLVVLVPLAVAGAIFFAKWKKRQTQATTGEDSKPPIPIGSDPSAEQTLGTGTAPDAGQTLGAGTAPDAGKTLGTGTAPDAGQTLGTGTAPNAGQTLGTGTASDAGQTLGAGIAPDAGQTPGAGTAPDAGQTLRTGTASDASPTSVGLTGSVEPPAGAPPPALDPAPDSMLPEIRT